MLWLPTVSGEQFRARHWATQNSPKGRGDPVGQPGYPISQVEGQRGGGPRKWFALSHCLER